MLDDKRLRRLPGPFVLSPVTTVRRGEVNLKKELLAREIGRILRDRQMTQTEASYLIREQPSQLSLITNGRLRGFSLDRLVKYLARLGCDVEVRIAPRKGRRAGAGKVSVQVR
jgi:predicted XRE-type DNA-binding protein